MSVAVSMCTTPRYKHESKVGHNDFPVSGIRVFSGTGLLRRKQMQERYRCEIGDKQMCES